MKIPNSPMSKNGELGIISTLILNRGCVLPRWFHYDGAMLKIDRVYLLSRRIDQKGKEEKAKKTKDIERNIDFL